MRKSTMRTVVMSEMTWPEYEQALKDNPVVFIPTGAVEQHGPHLPMGVDYMLPMAIARDVAENVGGIVAAPVTYGYKSMPRSGGGPFFPGSRQGTGQTYPSLYEPC